MTRLFHLHDALFTWIESHVGDLLPLLARLTFAGVLLVYFWNSAVTKLGEGIGGLFSPSAGAYIQVFPKVVEALGYDTSKLSGFHTAVVLAGTWAEFLLPLLIIVGLFSRLAALGMIGFIVVQSLTDVFGHAVGGEDLGRWFDGASGAVILDQRAFWLLTMAILVLRGGGFLSLDRLFGRT